MFLYFIYDAYTELFTSVSNGKSAIASAITDKGVSTASDATFQTMSNNIRSIPSPTAYATILSNQAEYSIITGAKRHEFYIKTLSLPIEKWSCNTYEIISFPTVTSASSDIKVGYRNPNTDYLYRYSNHIKVVKGSNYLTHIRYKYDSIEYTNYYKENLELTSITIWYSNGNLKIEFEPAESGISLNYLDLQAGDWLVVGY